MSTASGTVEEQTQTALDLSSLTVKNVTRRRVCVTISGNPNAERYFFELHLGSDAGSRLTGFNFSSSPAGQTYELCVGNLAEGKEP